jgi:hypothetical protein
MMPLNMWQICVTMLHITNELGDAVDCECYDHSGIAIFQES